MLPRFLSLALLLSLSIPLRAAESFEIQDGDRVLFLGDTLLEREGTYGYLETRMHEQFPDRRFTVRNLAFSADTPLGWSRASFDPAAKGFERLKEQIAGVRPTVVFLGYGMAASLQEMTDRSGDPTLNRDPARYGAEPMSAERFKKELGMLMDAIAEGAALGPLPKPATAGNDAASLSGTAARGQATAAEQSAAATTVEAAAASSALGPPPARGSAPTPKVRFVLLSPIRHEDLRATRPGLPDLARHNELLKQYTTAIEELAQERGARFIDYFTASTPPAALLPVNEEEVLGQAKAASDLNVNGIHLTELGYAFWAEDIGTLLGWKRVLPTTRESTAGWVKRKVALEKALLPAIIRKNELFFHQWRPANSTYLFGFRKHEQGQNAKEMPMYDPLIEQAEAEIDRLKRSPSAPTASAVDKNSQVGPPTTSGTPPTTSGTPPTGSGTAPTASGTPPTTSKASPTDPETPPTTSGASPMAPGNAPTASEAAPTPLTSQSVPSGNLAPSTAADPALPKPDFTVAEGYQIELWAENPLLYKPTQMNWDAEGRLWVASSALYPQIAPGGEASDTILVLEDADRDGKADKSTVFAGGLLIPTAVQPSLQPQKDGSVRYGCYVGQSTELLYFQDTDGDGHAETKRVVLSGFGTEDTHHIIHTLRRGPDRRLYFNQSVYIHSHVETPWGVVRLNSGGVFAWDPRTEKVEVYAKGLWNSWGLQFDKWGQSFQTDGAGSTGITWSYPGATFAPYEGSRRTMPSISPGAYPKFAGLELIYSPHFPADWQGNAVTCDFRAHRVVRFGVTDLSTGEKPSAGYTTQEMPDLVRTSDVSFRPIDVKLGPDGALYVADWSNPVINHGEVDFRDPRRDHTHGRIWRITKKATPLAAWEPVAAKKTPELLDRLLSANLWEKEQARNVLAKRLVMEIESRKTQSRATGQVVLGAEGEDDALPEIERWYEKDKSADRLREVALLESAFATVGWARFPALTASPEAGNRALVPRLTAISRSRAGSNPPLAHAATPAATPAPRTPPNLYDLPKLASDPNPRVRLEALRTLAQGSGVQAMDIVLEQAVKAESDPFLDFALWQSINDLGPRWTKAIADGSWKVDGREKQLEWGLNAIDPALAGATLARLLEDGNIVLNKGPWIELLGKAGGPAELAAIFESLIISFGADCCPGRNMTAPRATALSEADALRAIAALLDAVRIRNVLPEGELALNDLAMHAPFPLRPGLIRLAGYWKTKDAPEFLPALASAADGKPELRLAAIEALRALGGPKAQTELAKLTFDTTPMPIRRAAIFALTSLVPARGLRSALELLWKAKSEDEALGIWRELLKIQGLGDKLATAVAPNAATSLKPGNLTTPTGDVVAVQTDKPYLPIMPKLVALAGVRAAREGGKKTQNLLQVVTSIAGVSATQVLGASDFQRLAAAAKTSGDPAQGEMIYRRAASGCVTCHAIGGAGGIVGPALTSIGASAPLDYIVESMLAPNAKVKEGYNAVALKLKDGTEVTGIAARETAQEIILRNIAGQETAVPKAGVTGKTDVGSMMPAGLIDALSERERMHLYAFLGELGKPGPYDASKGNVARVWRLYSGAQEAAALRQDLTNYVPPVYTAVDGRLAQESLAEALPMLGDDAPSAIVTAQFEVAAGGKVRMNFTGIRTAWLDGQPLAIASEPNPAPVLAPGRHTLAVKLERNALPAILRAEAEGVNFLGNE